MADPQDTPPPTELVVVPTAAPVLRPEDAARAIDLLERTVPDTTRRGREQAATYLDAWHAAQYGGPLPIPTPVEVVVAFLVGHYEGLPDAVEAALVDAGVKRPGPHAVATLETRLAHLAKRHALGDLPSPCSAPVVRELMASLRRERVTRGGQRQPQALDLVLVDRLVAACLRHVGAEATPAGRLRGLRDAALVLGAWDAGGRRRSEILGLTVEDLVEDGDGLAWTLVRSKTDPEGEGLALWMGPRTAAAIREWLDAAEITAGEVFRGIDRHGRVRRAPLTGRGFAHVLKQRAAEAGLDPARISPHGLRAGFMTEGGKRGHSLQELMRLSGHRSAAMALRYHRTGAAKHNAAAGMAG